MEIRKIALSQLNHAQYNPRKDLKATDPEYKKLKRSIETFGYVEPIVYNVTSGNIVGGHQRVKVLQDLGYTEIDCVTVELNEQDEKALNIALNKISGEWDADKLEDLLRDLKLSDYDLSITGFDLSEIDDILGTKEVEEDNFDVDEALNNITEPISKRGDIWRLGTHRVMCGDSTIPSDVEKLMRADRADMVFTDPPWNVNYGAVEEDNAQGYKPRLIMNDFMGTSEFKEFMDAAFKNMSAASKNGCMTYVVMSAQEWGNMMLTLAQNAYHWSSTIIWNKDHLVLSRKDYHTKYEPLWYGWKEGEARLHPLIDRKQSDVWDIDRPIRSELHPTMKPIKLMDIAISNSSNREDIVLDLFGGSGSTLIACEQLNRICYMMELDEKYCDVIIKRYETLTGGKAELLKE